MTTLPGVGPPVRSLTAIVIFSATKASATFTSFDPVPHKPVAFRYCDTTSERAKVLEVCNAMRRDEDGRWTGDMTDGGGFIAALKRNGFDRVSEIAGGIAGWEAAGLPVLTTQPSS